LLKAVAAVAERAELVAALPVDLPEEQPQGHLAQGRADR
jgi:hypothetical protein